SSFYEKYKKTIGIGQVWFLPQEYEEENEQKNLLGSLIVFALTVREYILQLDYKEDLEDYIDNLKNFWNVSETKLVQFMLENDQNYYAWVPKEANIPNMYEVKIESVDVEEVL
ncbi:hypothetical protein SHK05_25480, partial [Bacillus paranthracis]|nr:hypothetical protein [Bacillus paranthracis]